MSVGGCEIVKCKWWNKERGCCEYEGPGCVMREDPKPLKWRTGPVPDEMAVFFHYFVDGIGDDYDVGEGRDDGHIGGYYTIEWQNARWLPLSDILALVED